MAGTDQVSSPTVSVILPVFDRLGFLRAAVASVFAQTLTDWELVIADDGSNEQTRAYLAELARQPRIRVVWLAHTGNPAAARNAALQEATGEFVAFLDSDDEWLPEKLATQVAALRDQPQRLWCYSPVLHIDAHGSPLMRKPNRRRKPPVGATFERIARWEAAIAMPSVIAQRQLVERVNRFDERQKMHEDCDLWLKLAQQSEVNFIDKPLSRVRHHTSHYSATGEQALRDWLALFEKWQAQVIEPAHKRLFRRQRARSTTRLARYYAAKGDATSAFTTIAGSVGLWNCAEWWSGSAIALARLVVPSKIVNAWRGYLG